MRFKLSTVLTLTTGKMLSNDGLSPLQELCEYLLGYPVWTHQIGRVIDEIKPHVLAQLPHLATIDGKDCNENNVWDWLDQKVKRFGDSVELEPIPPNVFEIVNPLQEAEEMFPGKVIITNYDPFNQDANND